MFDIKFTNNASTKLASILSDSATSLTITTGDGDKFPALVGDEYFIGTLVRGDGALEYVKVTARTGDTMTIERAQEGTTAVAFSADDVFELRLTAGSLNTILNIPSATESVEGTTQFATDVEITTGAEAGKAISPLRFQGYMDSITVNTPILTLPASATEGTTVNGTYSVESGATPDWTIPTAITDFVDDGAGNLSFTAPLVSSDTDYSITLIAVKPGYFPSFAASSTITIINVPIQDGPTITIANTTEGWSGATVNTGIVTAPATSVGTNNTTQFVSAIPEIIQTNGDLFIDGTTTTSSLVTVNEVTEGDSLVLETIDGTFDVTAGTVTVGTPTTYTPPGPLGGLSAPNPYLNTGHALPNGEVIKSLSVGMTVASTGRISIWRHDSGDDYTCMTGVNFSHPGSASLDTFEYFFDLPEPFEVPATGNYYVAVGAASGGVSAISVSNGTTGWYLPGGVLGVDDLAGETATFSTTNYASQVAYTYGGSYTVNIASAGLSNVPTTAIKNLTEDLKVGAGTTDEYLGPELTFTLGAGSTTTSIILESSESIKDKIYLVDGLHNNLLVDSVDVSISAASEVENAGTYTTTVIPTAELAQVPTTVSLPNRCTLVPTGYTHTITSGDLKITGTKITLVDNTALKRLAISVNSTTQLFKDGKIYTEEVI